LFITDLEPKTMGILEPTEFLGDGVTPRPNLEKDWATSGSNPRPPLDALLIPGLAFDRTGNRCGRGGGYYDAFISRYFEKCEKEFGASAAAARGAGVQRAGTTAR